MNFCKNSQTLHNVKYQPSSAGELTHRLQRLQNQNDYQGAPKVFGRSRQLLVNKFLDPSTYSMRKGHNRGEKIWGTTEKNMGKKYNDVFSVH